MPTATAVVAISSMFVVWFAPTGVPQSAFQSVDSLVEGARRRDPECHSAFRAERVEDGLGMALVSEAVVFVSPIGFSRPVARRSRL